MTECEGRAAEQGNQSFTDMEIHAATREPNRTTIAYLKAYLDCIGLPGRQTATPFWEPADYVIMYLQYILSP